MKKLIVPIILLTGLILRIILSFSIEYSITHGISSDDSYYYFRIAQNIVNGYGSIFDQINKTNGYQPLVMVFLVIVYKIFNSDIFTPVIISQLILSLISTLAAFLTFKFVKQISKSEFAGLLSIIFIFLNPVVIAINFKSLETNFYWLFLIVTFLFYEKNIKGREIDKSIFQYFVFGLLISFAAFSRLDGGFYILAFAIFLLFQKKDLFFNRLKKIFLSGTGFSILFVPYLVYNYLTFGNPVPISGRAKIFHNHRAILSQVQDYFTLDFFLYEIRRFLFPFNFDLFANRGFGLFEQIAVYIFIGVMIVFVIIFLRSGYFKRVISQWQGYGFIPLYLLFHYSFYTLYFWEYRFYYFLPEFIVLSILFAMTISNWIKDKFPQYEKRTALQISFITILIFTIGGIKIFTAQHEQTLALKTALWIKNNLEKDKVYSSANTGILSYFTQFRFVNLDGMVNNDELLNAYQKSEDKYLEYLKRKNINYIVDYFLSEKPENKYYFPKILNDKYEVVKVFTDNRLKYQKLNHMLVIKLKL